MRTNRRKFLQNTAGSTALLLAGTSVFANMTSEKTPIVRVARLKIDPAQLDQYKSLLKEGIETAVKVEPGVLSLYSVSEKENPANITVFEIYADDNAYKSHLETPHFKKYKTGTKDMVKSLELMEMIPVAMASK